MAYTVWRLTPALLASSDALTPRSRRIAASRMFTSPISHPTILCPIYKAMSRIRDTLSALLLSALPPLALAGSADLAGVVRDPAQLPVSNAEVRVTEDATRVEHRTVTDSTGAYHFFGVPPGRYEMRVISPGFRETAVSGIRLDTGDKRTVDVALELATRSQTVDVVAAAPLLHTETGTVSFVVDQHQAATLPLDGR